MFLFVFARCESEVGSDLRWLNTFYRQSQLIHVLQEVPNVAAKIANISSITTFLDQPGFVVGQSTNDSRRKPPAGITQPFSMHKIQKRMNRWRQSTTPLD
jgi:hypothetical protein